jgi:hypothetical protein
VVHDPRAGEVRGHRELRRFVRQDQACLAEHHARIETVPDRDSGGPDGLLAAAARVCDDVEAPVERP